MTVSIRLPASSLNVIAYVFGALLHATSVKIINATSKTTTNVFCFIVKISLFLFILTDIYSVKTMIGFVLISFVFVSE